MKNILIIAFCFIGFTMTEAQVKVVQPSPKSSIKQVIGLDSIQIEYSRPSMRGRDIFGGLVLYNELWRTGANENTTIEFYNTFNFGGTPVQAGKYALYTIPGVDSWEVILYGKADNWGASKALDPKHIVARCEVKPKRVEPEVETFLIAFSELKDSSANLNLIWENTLVEIPITVDTIDAVMQSIEETMGQNLVNLTLSWENTLVEIPVTVNTIDAVMQSIEETMGQNPTFNDYARAAEFYIKNNQDKDLALEWAQKAVNLKPDSFYALMILSKAYANFSDYTRAIEYAKKSKALAEKANYQSYVEQNEENIRNWSEEM